MVQRSSNGRHGPCIGKNVLMFSKALDAIGSTGRYNSDNPIRRFVISPQIFKIISQALMDPDFPEPYRL